MTDNPAVRAVAEQLHAFADHGEEGWAPLDESGEPRGVCNCLWKARTSLTALASSPEVREWLARELQRETRPHSCDPETPPDDQDKADHWVRCQVVTSGVLHALGGGE